ncbi:MULTISPECIES: PepSY domain-containing protein [unclassified Marinobacter]|uniref:PepSY domain-containing protein n=1 Tax=unclassified Marinobacter TaxID=83889 RepID=UPI001FF4F355|nr:PepSY domain-containing protein [Marinobacter sp. S6332]MCK0163052.1 PepSY domain-containing protein [Marinobacter sp. S6332]
MKNLPCYLLKLIIPTAAFIAAALAIAFCLTAAVPASADEDWRKLHEEVQAGRIKPLGEILDSLLRDWEGQVIDVEFEEDDGMRLYEIELLGSEGQVVEFEVNAVTGELIGIEGNNINGMKRQ